MKKLESPPEKTQNMPLAKDQQEIRNKLRDLTKYIAHETKELRTQGVIFEAGFENVRVASHVPGGTNKPMSKSFWMEAVIVEDNNVTTRIAIRT